jgi:branched-chain amino acid transport system ATP-binding protein
VTAPAPDQAAAVRPGADADAPLLRVDGVSRRFGGLLAVDGVTLSVGRGERLAVIGPNGAGKTTLFRLIAGEMRPTAGTVSLFGRDVTRMPAHRRARMGISRTFQVSNLFAGSTVEDNVRLAAYGLDWRRWMFWWPARRQDERARRAAAGLERVGLLGRAGAQVADLSHGEQRQLEIAMALVTGPKLLLLDEPAAGLAAAERARLRDLLAALPADLSVLLIEHDIGLAFDLCERVLCLDRGRPVAHGTPAELRADERVQAVYLGRAAR